MFQACDGHTKNVEAFVIFFVGISPHIRDSGMIKGHKTNLTIQ